MTVLFSAEFPERCRESRMPRIGFIKRSVACSHAVPSFCIWGVSQVVGSLQVVSVLLTELALLPIAHGYFLHMCAWPLVHTRPAISFGLSFVLLHWVLGMVCPPASMPPLYCCHSADQTFPTLLCLDQWTGANVAEQLVS